MKDCGTINIYSMTECGGKSHLITSSTESNQPGERILGDIVGWLYIWTLGYKVFDSPAQDQLIALHN